MSETDAQFLSSYNYQKVYENDTETINVASGVPYVSIKTVIHNLGYIPSTRIWYDPALGQRFPISVEQYVDDTTFTSEVNLITVRAYLTTTTLVIEASNASGGAEDVVLWWRIYYDD